MKQWYPRQLCRSTDALGYLAVTWPWLLGHLLFTLRRLWLQSLFYRLLVFIK